MCVFRLGFRCFLIQLLFLICIESKPSLNFNYEVSCDDYPYMSVRVVFPDPFNGVVHAVDHRSEFCQVFGKDSKNLTLRLNTLTERNAIDDCGIKTDDVKGDKGVRVVVRMNKDLETSEDQTFLAACNQTQYTNSKNEKSTIFLSLVGRGSQKTKNPILGRSYNLTVEQTKADDGIELRVGRCYSFNNVNAPRVELTNSRGCPLDPDTMSPFVYDKQSGTSQARIYSMFKLPGSWLVNINCFINLCRSPDCRLLQVGCDESLTPEMDRMLRAWEKLPLMTSTSVSVREPTETAVPLTDCSINYWWWLVGLCITFAVLFLIMLIVNILFCTALRCSCTKNQVLEREGSLDEEFDPYKVSNIDWSSEHYGSKYSLDSGKGEYPISGGSVIDYSTIGRRSNGGGGGHVNNRFEDDQLSSRSRHSLHSNGANHQKDRY